MHEFRRRLSAPRRLISLSRLSMLPFLLVAASASAQDDGHMRVQFGRGSAWADAGSDFSRHAPLPPGPAHANYSGFNSAEAGSQQGHVRLKPLNAGGY